MKEQWKKLDSDDKLLLNVEEGNQTPIKINIPLSALIPPRDEFCCNRLLTVLRVCVLLALLSLLGWTAAGIYSNYYDKSIAVDKESLENKFVFQNLVYKNKDEIGVAKELKKPDSDAQEFKDSTKKALDQIAAQIRGFNERLDQLQIERERQRMEIEKVSDDTKSIDDDVVISERSDQTLDSILDELAKEVGLTEKQSSYNVKYQSELDDIIFTEPCNEDFSDLQKQLERDRIKIMSLFQKLNTETKVFGTIDDSYEDYDFQNKVINDFNSFRNEKSNKQDQIGVLIGHNDTSESVYDNTYEEVQKETLGILNEVAGEAVIPNIENSHEDDKKVDQAKQAVIDRMTTSNLENDNDSEQQNEKEDEVKDEFADNQDDDNDLVGAVLSLLMNEAVKDESLSGHFDFENVEQSQIEDKAEKEMIEQLDEDKMLTEFVNESDMLSHEMMEGMLEETIMETEDQSTDDSPSLLGEIINFFVDDDENKEDNSAFIAEEKSTEYNSQSVSTTPFQVIPYSKFFDQKRSMSVEEESSTFSENKEMSINEQDLIEEDPITEKPVIDMVPSVEYVKKIDENPFIIRIAKMLEPIVGQNHELLIWYYTHKNLPEFLRGVDKWKVFGAKLLYDSNINDYPADATIVSGLAFEKVVDGAEYPSSSEEVNSELQQEIINRLILKSYLNKMMLEGNAEAETLSEGIEQHNLEKLKELDIDPQQLTYIGDFFEVDNKDTDDLIIPVVRFDPFVDESREANEQRARVIKAFGMTRNFDGDIIKTSNKKYRKEFFDKMNDLVQEPVEQSQLQTGRFDDAKENSEAEGLNLLYGHEFVTSEMSTQSSYTPDWIDEFLSKEEASTELINEEVNAENAWQPIDSVEEKNEEVKEEEDNMNDHLYSYFDYTGFI